MQFTAGDSIALAAVVLSVGGFGVREWRTKAGKVAAEAVAASNLQTVIGVVKAKIDEAMVAIGLLEQKRQAHELECARIQERTSANMARTAEILQENTRDIHQLQGQIRHVATGSADKLIEYPATKVAG